VSLAAIESHLGRLEVRTNVAGAELWISATREGTLPLAAPLRVVTGEVPIELRAPGYVTATRTVRITAGQLATETVTLSPDAQVVGPMGPGMGSTDLNEQTRARVVLIGGVGLGVPFYLPILGVGVRYGFFQNRFEIQGRADLSLYWNPFSSWSAQVMNAMGVFESRTSAYNIVGPLLGVDGTFRVRPISNRSPWYAGLGIMAKLGVIAAATPPPTTSTGGVTGVGALGPAFGLGIVIETGFLLGAESRWDLSFRFLGGFGALNGVITLGYAL
jgi:hypothetical protein